MTTTSILENISTTLFSMFSRIQKTKPEIGKNVTHENIKSEVLVSSEIVSKKIP